MGKEIAKLGSQMPAFLREVQNRVEDYTSGLSAGMPLPVLSFRGKEFRFRKDGHEVNTRMRDLEVIFVAPRKGVSKRFYAGPYAAGETSAPDCHSTDGITPDVANPVSGNCLKCPNNAWGSKITESGKEAKLCQDYKRICVVPILNNLLMGEPAVLDIPPTSLRAPKGYTGTAYMFREYLSILQKHDIPAEGAVTTLSFTDAEYPHLGFSFSRFATEAEFRKVMAMKEMPEVAEVLNEPAHEGPGAIDEAEPAKPSPAPAKPAKPAPAKPTKPAPKPGPEPEPEPEPAPMPEPEPEPEPNDEDALMKELEAVLGGK